MIWIGTGDPDHMLVRPNRLPSVCTSKIRGLMLEERMSDESKIVLGKVTKVARDVAAPLAVKTGFRRSGSLGVWWRS